MPIIRSKLVRLRADKTISYMPKRTIYVVRILNFFQIFIKSFREDFIYKFYKIHNKVILFLNVGLYVDSIKSYIFLVHFRHSQHGK